MVFENVIFMVIKLYRRCYPVDLASRFNISYTPIGWEFPMFSNPDVLQPLRSRSSIGGHDFFFYIFHFHPSCCDIKSLWSFYFFTKLPYWWTFFFQLHLSSIYDLPAISLFLEELESRSLHVVGSKGVRTWIVPADRRGKYFNFNFSPRLRSVQRNLSSIPQE